MGLLTELAEVDYKISLEGNTGYMLSTIRDWNSISVSIFVAFNPRFFLFAGFLTSVD